MRGLRAHKTCSHFSLGLPAALWRRNIFWNPLTLNLYHIIPNHCLTNNVSKTYQNIFNVLFSWLLHSSMYSWQSYIALPHILSIHFCISYQVSDVCNLNGIVDDIFPRWMWTFVKLGKKEGFKFSFLSWKKCLLISYI